MAISQIASDAQANSQVLQPITFSIVDSLAALAVDLVTKGSIYRTVGFVAIGIFRADKDASKEGAEVHHEENPEPPS